MNNVSRSWRKGARVLPILLLVVLAACGGNTTPLASTAPTASPASPSASGAVASATAANSAAATATRGTATSATGTPATATRAASATPGARAIATATRGTAIPPTTPATPRPTPTVGPTPTVPGPPIPVLPTIAVATGTAGALPPATSGGPATGGSGAPAQPVRAVSNTNPLRVYMAGDSFAEWIGADLTAYGQRSGPVTTSTDGKISSGLANPAFFDWPARLTQALATNTPDVVVIVLGANDLNGVSGSAGYFANGTQGWFTEYGRRQGQIMDIVGQSGAQMYWLAQPPMRDPGQNAAALAVNQSAQAQIASRPWVHYVDTWTLFSDGTGNYATTVIGANGQAITARQGDGLHLSREGATLLAASAYAQIRRDWGLP